MDFQLVHTAVTLVGDDLVASFTSAGTPPTVGTFTLSATLLDTTGHPIREVGWTVVDGAISSRFLLNRETGEQLDLAVVPQRVGSTWTAVFRDASGRVPRPSRWTTQLTVDGQAAGTCGGQL